MCTDEQEKLCGGGTSRVKEIERAVTQLEFLQSARREVCATEPRPEAAQHGVLAATGSRSTVGLTLVPRSSTWSSPKAHKSHMNCYSTEPTHIKE